MHVAQTYPHPNLINVIHMHTNLLLIILKWLKTRELGGCGGTKLVKRILDVSDSEMEGENNHDEMATGMI